MGTSVRAPLAGTPAREHTATRLLDVSAKHSFDPEVEIDWDAPLVPGRPATPIHRNSLYGTALWEGLSESQRVRLSEHEVASIASVGIWFEVILIQAMARHVYDRDPKSRHVQYALTEIGDECRHSVMFARLIEKLDAPAYGPGRVAHELGRFFKATSSGPSTFAAVLFVEEVLDSLQREAMRDESVQPLVQEVSRIHVIEESRHIRYARDELVRQWERLGPARRELARVEVALAASTATRNLIHSGAYAAVGLDPRAARRAARRNPHWRATTAWAARKVVADFSALGLIRGPERLIWRRAGLLT